MGIRETFIVNTSDNRVNPAIEEKQDQLLGQLTILADGGSTYYNTVNTVPANTRTSLVSFNPTKKIQVVRFYVTGTADAKVVLFIDGSPILTARNSVTKKDFDISFHGAEIKLNGSSSIEIKVYQWGPGTQEFSGTLFMKDRE